MRKDIRTTYEKFYQELEEYMQNGEELSVRKIYSLFPEINPKTVSWRLYELVQRGKIYRTGHGYYGLTKIKESDPVGYTYLQKKSQFVYDLAIDYGYGFYISGLDSLTGEFLDVPENYPVLMVAENAGISWMQEIFSHEGLIAVTEKESQIIKNDTLKDKIDVIILRGKDFSLSFEHIARKEKAFVDLYYAVTRMDYGVSVPELSRIYQSLRRKNTTAKAKIKDAARDRGISTEINWLLEINKAPEKVLEFMICQIKEVK